MSSKPKGRKVTFLKAQEALSKTFSWTKGKLTKHNYPLVKYFTSQTEEVKDLAGLYHALLHHAKEKHCMLKGVINEEIENGSRAGKTHSDTPTGIIVFDLDGVPLPDTRSFIRLLPSQFQRKDHILQYSASHGVGEEPEEPDLRAHLFYWNRLEVSPIVIKQWLVWFNLTNPVLRAAITLSGSKNALRWPLDVTINQNDKLIYIAPPKLAGNVPVWDDQPRIQYIQGKTKSVAFDFSTPKGFDFETEKKKLINELREKEGLEPAKFNYTVEGEYRVLRIKKGEACIGSYKVGDEFTHCNMDNPNTGYVGNSRGYYYLTRNPWLLHNFKEEPIYRLKEIDPDHYEEAVARARRLNRVEKAPSEPETKLGPAKPRPKKKWGGLAPGMDSAEEVLTELAPEPDARHPKSPPSPEDVPEGTQAFVFIERRTGDYHRGLLYPCGKHELFKTKNLHIFKNFQKTWGLDTRDEIEEWDILYDPTDLTAFTPANRFINTYQRSKLLIEGLKATPPKDLPPIFSRVIRSATGDEQSFRWFVNWVACILQLGMKTTTACVLQGTYGTGKGLLLGVLTMLLGEENVTRADFETMATSQFNSNIESKQLAAVDEADMDSVWGQHRRRVHKVMKEYITELNLLYRRMYTEPYLAPSFVNFLIMANEKHTAFIAQNDRRYTVCARQDTPLSITKAEIDKMMEEELPQIAAWFMHFECDEAMARTPLENKARRLVQKLSMDSNEEVFEAIIQGDFKFLIDSWPDEDLGSRNEHLQSVQDRLMMSYLDAMREIYENREKGRISRHAIESIVWHLTGNKQPTAHKATKWINHHGLDIELMRLESGPTRGYEVKEWFMPEEVVNRYLGRIWTTENAEEMKDKEDKARAVGKEKKKQRTTHKGRVAQRPGKAGKDTESNGED